MAIFLASSSFVSRCRDAIWRIHILTSAPMSVHDSIHVHLHLLQYSRLFSHLAGNDFVAARHMSLIPQNELCRTRDATREDAASRESSSSFLLPTSASATSPSLSSSSLIVLSFPHWPLYCCLCLSVHCHPSPSSSLLTHYARPFIN